MSDSATYRTRYRFVTRIESEVVEGGIYVWESVEPIPGDSRHDQIRCAASWFFPARSGSSETP
ncbi:MAG: hypothetical protein ACTHON_19000 [Humibacter sp.]